MKVVLANGCFDGLHAGHVTHLQQARGMGDRLVVSVTRDDFVSKGKGRPVFTAHQRAAVLFELECVDNVVIVDGVIEALERIKPAIFVKGPDYVNSITPIHQEFCDKNGIEIRFTTGEKLSSTALFK